MPTMDPGSYISFYGSRGFEADYILQRRVLVPVGMVSLGTRFTAGGLSDRLGGDYGGEDGGGFRGDVGVGAGS